jgi:hypothetical protein
MAHLINVPPSAIKAFYDPRNQTLSLLAHGEIPGWLLTPFFRRDKWIGGVKFSLCAYAAGLGPSKDAKPFDISQKVLLPHFDDETILAETALGTWIVTVNYGGATEGVNAAKSSNSVAEPTKYGTTTKDVLPPIDKVLLSGHELVIDAIIPKEVGNSNIWVDPSFNPEYLKLVNATYGDGTIQWTFMWAKIPTSQNRQSLDIIKHTWNGIVGPDARNSVIIQPYIVTFGVLQ